MPVPVYHVLCTVERSSEVALGNAVRSLAKNEDRVRFVYIRIHMDVNALVSQDKTDGDSAPGAGGSLFGDTSSTVALSVNHSEDNATVDVKNIDSLLQRMKTFNSDVSFDEEEARIAKILAEDPGDEDSSDSDDDRNPGLSLNQVKQIEKVMAARPTNDTVSSLPLTQSGRHTPPPSVVRVYRKTFDSYEKNVDGKVHVGQIGGHEDVIRRLGVGSVDGFLTFEEFVDVMEKIKRGAFIKEEDMADAEAEEIVRVADGDLASEGNDFEDLLAELSENEKEAFLRNAAHLFDRISNRTPLATVDQILATLAECSDVDPYDALEFHFALIAAADSNGGSGVDFDSFVALVYDHSVFDGLDGVAVRDRTVSKETAGSVSDDGSDDDGEPLERKHSVMTSRLMDILNRMDQPDWDAAQLEIEVQGYVDSFITQDGSGQGDNEHLIFGTLSRLQLIDSDATSTANLVAMLEKLHAQREILSTMPIDDARNELRRMGSTKESGGGIQGQKDVGHAAESVKPLKSHRGTRGIFSRMKNALEREENSVKRKSSATSGLRMRRYAANIKPKAVDPELEELVEEYLTEKIRPQVTILEEKMSRKLQAKEHEYEAMRGYLADSAVEGVREYDREKAEAKLAVKVRKLKAAAYLDGLRKGLIPTS